MAKTTPTTPVTPTPFRSMEDIVRDNFGLMVWQVAQLSAQVERLQAELKDAVARAERAETAGESKP